MPFAFSLDSITDVTSETNYPEGKSNDTVDNTVNTCPRVRMSQMILQESYNQTPYPTRIKYSSLLTSIQI